MCILALKNEGRSDDEFFPGDHLIWDPTAHRRTPLLSFAAARWTRRRHFGLAFLVAKNLGPRRFALSQGSHRRYAVARAAPPRAAVAERERGAAEAKRGRKKQTTKFVILLIYLFLK